MRTGVELHREGPIAFVRLDGADRLNAISTHTCQALAAAVREIDADRTIRAAVVQGAGRAFCAGADIEEISGFEGTADYSRFVHGLTDALELIERSPVPFIAAITGPAFGGGLELAMACDLRVIGRDARVGLPEAKLGVLPGAAGTQRLPRLVPRGIALEMLMLGEPISGERAYALGLANRVCDRDEVLATATELAHALAAGAPLVPQLAKRLLLLDTENLSVADGVVVERQVATELFDSPDGREGFAAFVAKRPPKYSADRP
jgi:enoyl-CoA hydratase/carnithine racemase